MDSVKLAELVQKAIIIKDSIPQGVFESNPEFAVGVILSANGKSDNYTFDKEAPEAFEIMSEWLKENLDFLLEIQEFLIELGGVWRKAR